jgi:hypothetical protein
MKILIETKFANNYAFLIIKNCTITVKNNNTDFSSQGIAR